jgi:cytoskeletal protein CcmA (bactofilin family)
MGDTYTRQSSSSIVDGTTIEAAHFNNEFDQLVAAFAVSSGHTHDGTAAEGGPVTKLLGNTLTFGAGTASTDITVTFDGESNDGVLKWMEDEDYFEFSDDILVASNERLNFRDTALYIHSSADGQLDLVADTEIQIAATTVDINGNVDVSGTLTVAGAVDFGDAALSNVGAVQLDSIAGDGDTNTSITFSGSDVITIATGGSGRLTIGDGALSPVTNNQIDLGTSSLEFKDAFFDGTVTSDAFAGPLTGDVTGNVSGTAATVTGAAQSNITSLGTLTTLTVDNVITNGSNIGHTSDTDLLTLASGILTVAGEVSMTTLDIGGTNVTSTAAELNLVDGITAGTVSASLAVIADANKDISGFRNVTLTGELDAATLDISGDADIDGTLEADAITVGGTTLAEVISDTVGAMVGSNTETGVAVSYDDSDNTLDFVLGTAQTTIESVKNTSLAIGRDDDNLIKFSTDNQIIFEVSGGDNVIFKASGEIEATSLDISGDADIDGTLEADAITVNGSALATVIAGTTVTSATNAAHVSVADNENTNEENLIPFIEDASATGNVGLESDGDFAYNPSTGTVTATIFKGNIDAVDGDFDGTLEADAITVGGTNISSIYSVIAGSSNIVTTGALNSGSITSGFGTIDTGSSTITTTGLISGGSLDIDNVLINGTTIGHTDDTDLITVADGLVTVAGEVQMTTLDIGGTNVTATAAELNFSDLATLGTTAASKVYTADANGLTKISGAALYTEDTLTDGSTVAWDVIASPVAKLTMAGNRTLSAPSGTTPAAGQFVSLLLIQDGSGSRTITFNAVYEFTGDVAPTLTTTANKGDLFVFRYNGSKWLEVGRNLNLTLS